jgi:hypothetical protein
MAQPIQSYAGHAADALQQANVQRGNAGMNSLVPPIKNAADNGRYTKPTFNPQTEVAQAQVMNKMKQDITSATAGQSANAERVVDNKVLAASQQMFNSQTKLAEHVSQMVFASGQGQAIAQMAEAGDRVKRHVALQTLQSNGINTFPGIPDIG